MTAWVRAEEWQPPPPAALFGERTRDGTRIMLIGQGTAYDMNRAGAELKHLTPLIKKESSDAVSVVCSWAAVTQLAHTFTGNGSGLARWVPGPSLQAWIQAEFARRTAPPSPLKAEFPPGLTLRPYQEEGAAQIANARRFLLLDEPGPQPVDTPVWTPDGWCELGSLVPGDIVYNLHGHQVPVRTVRHFGQQPVYRVTFSDGTSTLATGDHRWRVWAKNDRTGHNGVTGKTGRIMSTDQILVAGLKSKDGAARYWLPQQPVLDSPEHSLPLDPYAYGALLGDGSLGMRRKTAGRQTPVKQPRCEKPVRAYKTKTLGVRLTAICGRPAGHPGHCRSSEALAGHAAQAALADSSLGIACPDSEILFSVAAAATALGTTWRWNTPPDRCQSLSFHRRGRLREVLAGLEALVHSEDKRVHPVYLRAGTAARRALLAGLLDTDGCVAKASVEFSSASSQLAADVAWLARSLGAVVTEAKPQAAGYLKNGVKTWCRDKHRLHMRFPADGPNPFTLPRKADPWAAQAARVQRRNPPRTFQAIELAGTSDVCCIELDTDDDLARVYLTDTALIPTHNCGKTACTIAGLAEIQARGGEIFPAVIVVPSWDVADVWMREIAAWMPGWRTVCGAAPAATSARPWTRPGS